MIYSSSPDRGLELLLSLFPKVKEQVPEAKLDIFYGFENFQDQEYVKKMMDIIMVSIQILLLRPKRIFWLLR